VRAVSARAARLEGLSRLRVGGAFVSKIIAFAWVAAALAFCYWLTPWRAFAAEPHEAGTALLLAGGLFTVAIAVLIRD
jgi:hypothetical protein